MRPSDGWTLGRAKDWLRLRLDEGERCPCCNQRAQTYRRKLNKTMIRALAALEREQRIGKLGPDEYLHAPTLLRNDALAAREVGKLAYWGLVVEGSNPRTDGGHAGMWRVSIEGMKFLRGTARVPKYAKVYDGRVLGYDGDLITVDEVAPEFRLDDLLAGV